MLQNHLEIMLGKALVACSSEKPPCVNGCYFTAGEAICIVKNDIGGGVFLKLLFAESQDTPCQQHDAKRGSDQQGGENLLRGAGP